ncbi:transmembrane protein [Legionella birminghamensis]|uniref:Transmembrane protein n=1 Tax=Legionella birminghamensis TaxID=28083 RepID=A0A378I6A8_9GAMM|nr:Mpo1-like protein [Legionella birminghamensis]KTC68724.1 transmembrane protein [Legionella birminghamensis]STX30290.1 transmembrane protein [Legionella birminghamensis]
MKTFLEQAYLYRQYHQEKTTLYTHLAGVPLIIFSLMIFFGYFHVIVPGIFDVTLAEILTAVLFIYYLKLNWRLALLLLPILAILLWISAVLSNHGPDGLNLWVFVICFVIGWALQLAGHFMEGTKPAFMTNAQQALVAPLFLIAELCFMAGYMPKLREELHGPETIVVTEPVSPVTPPPTLDSEDEKNPPNI